MANLPKEAIEEFKKLYAKHYGVELSDEEARRRASNLIDLYGVVYDGYDVYKIDGKWYKKPK